MAADWADGACTNSNVFLDSPVHSRREFFCCQKNSRLLWTGESKNNGLRQWHSSKLILSSKLVEWNNKRRKALFWVYGVGTWIFLATVFLHFRNWITCLVFVFTAILIVHFTEINVNVNVNVNVNYLWNDGTDCAAAHQENWLIWLLPMTCFDGVQKIGKLVLCWD